ncbi:unnamed protein product, partial [Allacma fusca]
MYISSEDDFGRGYKFAISKQKTENNQIDKKKTKRGSIS